MLENASKLESILGYSFRRPEILERAVTHSSAANERKFAAGHDNEQMEFLGDSIIGFFVSDFLFREHTSLSEGELSKVRAHLVSAANLSKLSCQLELGEFLVLGKGEEKTGGRRKQALLADTFEALVAAIYIDGGLEQARNFLLRIFKPDLDAVGSGGFRLRDFKSQLQEKLQALHFPPAEYCLVKETGPDHRKYFSVELKINGRRMTEGHGGTKKRAEQEAARLALEALPATTQYAIDAS
ncbi:MAG: ribonuclease III [Acidobacteria bacterium]|nr:ribonuclease III [Acidobacteriota bacterium]